MVDEEDLVVLVEEEIDQKETHLCLIGTVLTRKTFNAFGFLEAMKRAMNPSKGFTAKEIGKNLFSFQFRAHADLEEVLKKEPWHFEKNLVALKKLGDGEQPSSISFSSIAMWVRLYDQPWTARTEKNISSIAGRCGEVLEIDKQSMSGFGRSIRVRVQLDFTKPLKIGQKVAGTGRSPSWVPFKYERIPTFCYICGKIGHMKRECELTEEGSELLTIPDAKLPYGEWLKASPLRKASVSISPPKTRNGHNFNPRRLLENLEGDSHGTLKEKECNGVKDRFEEGGSYTEGIEEVRKILEKVAVSKRINEAVEGEASHRETMQNQRKYQNAESRGLSSGDISSHGSKNNPLNPPTTQHSMQTPTTKMPLTPLSTLKELCNKYTTLDNPTNLATHQLRTKSPAVPACQASNLNHLLTKKKQTKQPRTPLTPIPQTQLKTLAQMNPQPQTQSMNAKPTNLLTPKKEPDTTTPSKPPLHPSPSISQLNSSKKAPHTPKTPIILNEKIPSTHGEQKTSSTPQPRKPVIKHRHQITHPSEKTITPLPVQGKRKVLEETIETTKDRKKGRLNGECIPTVFNAMAAAVSQPRHDQ